MKLILKHKLCFARTYHIRDTSEHINVMNVLTAHIVYNVLSTHAKKEK